MNKASIFVVEDETAFYDIYNTVFSLIGAELAGWAYSGEEAVVRLKELANPPDLILMDHRLPGMNGVETMVAIAKFRPGIKTLFVSADGSVEGEAVSCGAIGFLLKPFELNDFIAAISKSLPDFATHMNPERAKIRKLKLHRDAVHD